MEKTVVRFGRSTTIKDDLCYHGALDRVVDKALCPDCRVHLLTDRFLSEPFQKEIMHDTEPYPDGKYPYVIIIDTAYCNLRCRPCYSWKYWNPYKNPSSCDPCTVSPEMLADQFRCKLERLGDSALLEEKPRLYKSGRPFSRFRISGGEPLFDPNSSATSLPFWITFFQHLDHHIWQLIQSKVIHLASEADWKVLDFTAQTELFPCFLQADNGKIRIRFDTNGLLFRDPNFADAFIKGIYELKLEFVKIDLTFSLKGTNSQEYNSFVSLKTRYSCPTEEDLEDHPQWQAIENICNFIKKYEDPLVLAKTGNSIISTGYFNPCGEISLTLERGIMHSVREKTFIISPNHYRWETMEAKLAKKGLTLSPTENSIYFQPNVEGKTWSYIKHGNCEISLRCSCLGETPYLSCSLRDSSETRAKKHLQVNNYAQMEAIVVKMKRNCRTCPYSIEGAHTKWIELIPLGE